MDNLQGFEHYLKQVKAAHESLNERELFYEIMAHLLDFTAFTELNPAERPTPFDDPLVGAFLVTAEGDLIGAHRKVASQERHAEPNSIVAALGSINSVESSQLIEKIDHFYQQKLWLESERKQKEFETLFIEGGRLLKQHFNTKALTLYSSLEPCRDYETQPSCADIVSSTGIETVIYGSDDLNEKGLGRDTLISNGISVHPNIDINAATNINALFFGSLYLSQRFFDINSAERLFFPPKFYSVFDTRKDRLPVVPKIGKNDRMVHLPNPAFPLQQYTTGPLLSEDFNEDDFSLLKEIEKSNIDQNIVLQCGDLSAVHVARILADISRSRSTVIPGTILHSRDELSRKNPISELEAFRKNLLSTLENLDITIHENAFRKLSEKSEARRKVFQRSLRVGDSSAIFVLAKSTMQDSQYSTYEGKFGKTADLTHWLTELCSRNQQNGGRVSRLSLFCDLANAESIVDLINHIFGSPRTGLIEVLRRTGLEIEFQKDPYDMSSEDSALQRVRERLSRLAIANRTNLKSSWERPIDLPSWLLATYQNDHSLDPNRLDPTTLAGMSNSESWEDRRDIGELLGMQVCADIHSLDDAILAPLQAIVADGLSEENWAKTCVLFNALKHVWSNKEKLPGEHLTSSTEQLIKISETISTSIELLDASPPWMVDVVWRLTVNLHFFVPTDRFATLPEAIRKNIASNSFLISESLYYWYATCEQHTDASPWSKLPEFLGIFPAEFWSEEAANAFSTRLLRLFALDAASKSIDSLKPIMAGVAAYKRFLHTKNRKRHALEESKKLRNVFGKGNDGQLGGGNIRMLQQDSDQFSTFAGLQTLSISTKKTLYAPLPSSKKNIRREQGWRTDYFGLVTGLLSERPTNFRCAELLSLCSDSDVSLRLAAIRSVLDRAINPRDFGFPENKTGHQKLLYFREDCLRTVRLKSNIYWIDRAIAQCLLDIKDQREKEISEGVLFPIFCPDLKRSGLSDLLLNTPEAQHPEVTSIVKKLQAKCCKVLFVLPPIHWHNPSEPATSRGGTPPLGIGLLASIISADGHFVELIDAHRDSYEVSEVAEYAKQFDVIAISCVFSTLEATKELSHAILQQAVRPKVVLGGQGVSLGSASIIGDKFFSFDALFLGNSLTEFARYINSLQRLGHDGAIASLGDGRAVLVPNREESLGGRRFEKKILSDATSDLASNWLASPWINRSLFVNKSGRLYEPFPTRNGKLLEAHLVTSTGCNWGCKFCTEAVINGGPKEVRRAALDVIAEAEFLVGQGSANRLQFVDDNIFPSAPLGGRRDWSVDWTEEILAGLTDIKNKHADFSWRGLMRIEDLLVYEDAIPQFYRQLRGSGCKLVALGVEYGNEELRKKSKGSSKNLPFVSNQEIRSVLQRFSDEDIFTKGYFIVGGPGENQQSVMETISFAKSCGFSLAYFAIYKEFRSLAKSSGSEAIAKFKEFSISKLGEILDSRDKGALAVLLGKVPSKRKLDDYFSGYRELAALGFDFENIFKYNDYHSDDRNIIYESIQADVPYLGLVLEAYLEFYARTSWAKTYKKLVNSGY